MRVLSALTETESRIWEEPGTLGEPAVGWPSQSLTPREFLIPEELGHFNRQCLLLSSTLVSLAGQVRS